MGCAVMGTWGPRGIAQVMLPQGATQDDPAASCPPLPLAPGVRSRVRGPGGSRRVPEGPGGSRSRWEQPRVGAGEGSELGAGPARGELRLRVERGARSQPSGTFSDGLNAI